MFARTWFALEPSVPVVPERTRAMGHPVGDPALRVRPAGPLLQTRIPAHFVGTASFARLAVVVPVAGVSDALDVRLALEPVRARAHGSAIDDAALGVLPAGRFGRVARVFASPVLARAVGGAIGAGATSDRAHAVRTHVSLRKRRTRRLKMSAATRLRQKRRGVTGCVCGGGREGLEGVKPRVT